MNLNKNLASSSHRFEKEVSIYCLAWGEECEKNIPSVWQMLNMNSTTEPDP